MSDSESDDDLFRDGPTFSKKARSAETRKERRMLDYLDVLIKKEQEQSDRRGRIAEMIKEEHKVRHEMEKVAESDEPSLKRPRTEAVTTITDATKDESPLVSPSPTAPRDLSDSSIDSKSPSIMSKFDIDDPAYWKIVEAYTKNAETNFLEREKRRRDIHEAVEGYNDVLYSDTDATNKDAFVSASIDSLRRTCVLRQLSSSGTRAQLIYRIVQSLANKSNGSGNSNE